VSGYVKFNHKRLKKAIEIHGENVVKTFAQSTFKDIVKSTPQKGTFSASGKYIRTGTLRDGWNIAKTVTGYMIFNETEYAPYYEYGHRKRGGGVVKGAYLMSNAVDANLLKYGLTASRGGGL